MPLLVGSGLAAGGAWTWSGAAVVFVVVPLLEAACGRTPAQAPHPRSRADDLPLWLVLPTLAALTAFAIHLAADPSRLPYERLGAALSAGLVNGAIGITAAHELIHRKAAAERALGEALLVLVNWVHYPIEHVLGHHRTVGTPEDPATAPRGMGLWRYLPRVLFGEPRSAWRLEGQRLRRRGEGAGTWRDRRMRGALEMIAINGGVAALWGFAGWLAFAASGLTAVVLLQGVQYVEHYGLVRGRRPDGSWEEQTAAHAWDSEHAVSKALLFRLPRHADHHLMASRPYSELQSHPESPQMPGGYAQMILLAAVPPLWRRWMDPRLPPLPASPR